VDIDGNRGEGNIDYYALIQVSPLKMLGEIADYLLSGGYNQRNWTGTSDVSTFAKRVLRIQEVFAEEVKRNQDHPDEFKLSKKISIKKLSLTTEKLDSKRVTSN